MLKQILYKWLKLIIAWPKSALAFVAVITIIMGSGLGKLQSDNSIEFLMPQEEPIYLLGERANLAFLKSKTFVLTSIEPAPGKELFSSEVFQHIHQLVSELEEYKVFNRSLETQRLDTIIELGGASVESGGEENQSGANEPLMDEDLEAQLDALILSGESDIEIEDLLAAEQPANDIWDLDKALPQERFTTPIRTRQIYNFEDYNPVSLSQIRIALDKAASAQVDTIINTLQWEELDQKAPLSPKQYQKFLNAWEEIYLFKSMEMVQTFMNPITGEDISGENNELKPVDFIETDEMGMRYLPSSAPEFDDYQNRISLNPLNELVFYSQNANGEIQALSFSLVLKSLLHYNKFLTYLWPLIRKYNTEPVVMYANGSLIIEKFMDDFVKSDLSLYMPMVLLIVIITFYLNFRSLRGVVLPALTVIIGAIWTMGLMGHLGIKVSLLVSILPPLLIAIGSSYSIHMFNQYMHELPTIADKEKESALLHCMTHISVTILLATVTTMISFLTLSISQVTSLRDFGMFAAAGSFFATLAAFILIPASLSLLKPLRSERFYGKQKLNPIVEKIIQTLAHLSLNRAKTVVSLFSLIFLIGLIGLVSVRPETAPMYNFRDDSYIRKSDDRLGQLFHGTFANDLIIDSGKAGGVKDPEFLNFVEKIRDWAELPEQEEKYNILLTVSFNDFIKRMHMAFYNDNPDYFAIPESREQISDYLEIFSGEDKNSDGRPDSFEAYVDAEYRRVNLIIRTGSTEERLFSTAVNRAIEVRVDEYMRSIDNPADNPNGYTWFMAGAGINISILADYIIESQLTSVILSLIIISFLVFVLFRSGRASFVSIVPISFGIAVVYGLMGYLDIPLDIPKAILSSVAIGIGIDDTIHFMKTLSHHLKANLSLDEAIEKTYHEAGVAITYTSLALIFGFSILTLSHFKPIFFLGMLVAAVMLATTLGALLFLPAIIKLMNLKIRNIDIDDDFDNNGEEAQLSPQNTP